MASFILYKKTNINFYKVYMTIFGNFPFINNITKKRVLIQLEFIEKNRKKI